MTVLGQPTRARVSSYLYGRVVTTTEPGGVMKPVTFRVLPPAPYHDSHRTERGRPRETVLVEHTVPVVPSVCLRTHLYLPTDHFEVEIRSLSDFGLPPDGENPPQTSGLTLEYHEKHPGGYRWVPG